MGSMFHPRFGTSNTWGGVWSNAVVQNRETNEKHHEDFVEEGPGWLE